MICNLLHVEADVKRAQENKLGAFIGPIFKGVRMEPHVPAISRWNTSVLYSGAVHTLIGVQNISAIYHDIRAKTGLQHSKGSRTPSICDILVMVACLTILCKYLINENLPEGRSSDLIPFVWQHS